MQSGNNESRFLYTLGPKLGQKEEEMGHQTLTQYQSPVIRAYKLDKCHRESN